ncbi:MAG: hemolysin D, partial [Planctomycetota bacterium]
MVKTFVQSSHWILVLCLIASGCGRSDDKVIERRPRPVITSVLSEQLPPTPALVTASASAWKTEDLGFEVAGRIEFVADQNTEIQGRIRDSIGDLIMAGTPIARIESERYELGLAKAEAALARA